LACDPAWALEYAANEFFRADPWLRYAASHSAPIKASDLRCVGQQEAAVVSLAAKFGFSNAALIPAPSPEGQARIGLLVVGSSLGDAPGCLDTSERRAHARHLSMALHEAWAQQEPAELAVSFRLSKLQKRLLQMELEGLCTKAIARNVNMTCKAVDSQFQRINRRASVGSRRLAALLALKFGLIEVGARQSHGQGVAAEEIRRDESHLHSSLAG